MLSGLLQDLRYGGRTLRRSPWFTAVVVVTLGVGIGANAAMFSLANALFLRPLPVRDPGSLVLFSDRYAKADKGVGAPAAPGGRLLSYTYPLYRRLRDQREVFARLAAEEVGTTKAILRRTAAGEGETAELDDVAEGDAVSADYFEVLGVQPALGRSFRLEDDAPGAEPTVILGHAFWRRHFAADPALVGQRIEIDGRRRTVIGVAPAGFTGTGGGDRGDFWVTLGTQAAAKSDRPQAYLADPHRWRLTLVGRLAPGVSMDAAQAAANLTLQQYLADVDGAAPSGQRAVRVGLEPGARGNTRRMHKHRALVAVLMASVGLLLVVVFLNVSHLLLARALHRQHEMSVRTALGATPGRLLRQLLIEGLLLSGLGGLAGLIVTRWLTDGLLLLAADGDGPPSIDLGADVRVLGFTALLVLAGALILGLVPAWQAARSDLQGNIRATSPAVIGAGPKRRLGRGLLLAQVALSLVLLVAAGLLAGTLSNLRALDKGIDESHLLLVRMAPGKAGITNAAQGAALYADLLRRVTALPDVRAAGLSSGEPLDNSGVPAVVVEPATARAAVEMVTPSFFEAAGMILLRGRPLGGQDVDGAPLVGVVNEPFARQVLGTAELDRALGRRFRLADVEPIPSTPIAVVGVVKAATDRLGRQPPPAVYLAAAQIPDVLLNHLLVRVADPDPQRLAEQVRAAVHQARPTLPVTRMRSARLRVEDSLREQRILATLSGAFGTTALFLVCLGLYGVISQWVGQRTREIGVRLALGATSGRVRWLVLRQAFALVIAGLAVGLPAALAAAQLLRGMLFGVSPADPATLAAAAAAMLTVATLAAYLPARRASRADPMAALRSE
jgi:predicted permease